MLKKVTISWIFSLICLLYLVTISKGCQASPQIVSDQEKTQNLTNLEVINYWTQHFFYLIRPEVQGREVQIYEKIYQREQVAIAEVINHILFSTCQKQQRNHYFFLTDQETDNDWQRYSYYQYPQRGANSNLYNRELEKRINNYHNQRRFILEKNYLWNNDYSWRQNRDYFFERFYQDLTDAIFYARHPEISLEEKKSQNFNLATEWNLIRRHFANYDQEEFLKKYFMPICR